MGLALSYFYNFLLPTASNWKGLGTEMLVDNEIHKVKDGPVIYVFIPRTLNEIDMKAQLKQLQASGAAFLGKPVELQGTSHRPMFLFVLQKDSSKKSVGYCFDVPTAISSCYDRANSVKGEEDRAQAMNNLVRELVDFQNNLQDLVSQHDSTRNSVALVSVPPPPFDAAVLAHIAGRVHETQ